MHYNDTLQIFLSQGIHMSRNNYVYLLLNMAALAAFGPFVTDFYLPALPDIQILFDTTTSRVQLSITFSLIGLAFGQLIMGPLSDKYGRKPILLLSLLLFVLSTIACLLSWDIYSFLVFRLIQGISGSGGIVISKSVVADLFEGEDLAKFFALLGAIQGLAPIIAPVLGGIMLRYTDWHGIFSVLLGIGIVLCVSMLFFKESLPATNRIKGSFLESFAFWHILKNKEFMLYVILQSFAMGIMFSFIASSSFIFQAHFGLSGFWYSLCFAGAAFSITLGASVTPIFKNERLALCIGIIGLFVCGLGLCVLLQCNPSLFLTELGFGITLVFLGFILPTSTALAMEMERSNAGNASAILGFSFFTFGGVLSPLTGIGDNMFASVGAVIALCCLGVGIFGYIVLRKPHSR